MTPVDPNRFRRRVLVCSVGLSPQVVTEALFATSRGEGGWRPSELILFTTAEGQALAKAVLLDPTEGALRRLARDRGWSWLHDLPVQIVVPGSVASCDGEAAIADAALDLMRQLCGDPEAMVHVVLTGGRKTAAAAMALALALLARPQDRMSHVLVDDKFVSNPAFFFPPRQRSMILGSDGGLHDASAAEVALLEVPFPRLRTYAGTAVPEFAAAIAEARSRVGRWQLTVNMDIGGVLWNGQPIGLPPVIAAFAAWLADDLLHEGQGLARKGAPTGRFLAAYRRLRGRAAADAMAARLGPHADAEWVEEKASRLNKLADACDGRPRGASLVVRTGKRARARYRLSLDAEEIDWIGPKLDG